MLMIKGQSTSSAELTVIVRVQLCLQLLHFSLISQQRPLFLQCAHPILLLLFHRLLDQRVFLIVCDAWIKRGEKEKYDDQYYSQVG